MLDLQIKFLVISKLLKRLSSHPWKQSKCRNWLEFKCHSKRVLCSYWSFLLRGIQRNLLLQPLHTELKLGSSRVSECIKKLTGKAVTLPSHTTVGTVTTANILWPMLAPKTLITEEGNLWWYSSEREAPIHWETCSHTRNRWMNYLLN